MKISLQDFIELYGVNVPEKDKWRIAELEKILESNPSTEILLEKPIRTKPDTSDTAPWTSIVPQEEWSHQGQCGIGIHDSTTAGHNNAITVMRYSSIVQVLSKKGFNKDWIREICRLAYDTKQDPIKVAEVFVTADDPQYPILDNRIKSTQKVLEAAKKREYFPPAPASFKEREVRGRYRPSDPKERFSHRIEERIRLARQERLKNKKGRK